MFTGISVHGLLHGMKMERGTIRAFLPGHMGSIEANTLPFKLDWGKLDRTLLNNRGQGLGGLITPNITISKIVVVIMIC